VVPTTKKDRIAATLAVLEAGQLTKELEIRITDDPDEEPLVFRYRPLGWLAKSRAVSAASEFAARQKGDSGEYEVSTIFHLDIYKVVALRAMLVDPPIPLDDKVLENMSPEIGEQFDTIIPDPFTVPAKAAAIKKG
jgi:hypothetical protein